MNAVKYTNELDEWTGYGKQVPHPPADKNEARFLRQTIYSTAHRSSCLMPDEHTSGPPLSHSEVRSFRRNKCRL